MDPWWESDRAILDYGQWLSDLCVLFNCNLIIAPSKNLAHHQTRHFSCLTDFVLVIISLLRFKNSTKRVSFPKRVCFLMIRWRVWEGSSSLGHILLASELSRFVAAKFKVRACGLLLTGALKTWLQPRHLTDACSSTFCLIKCLTAFRNVWS